MPYADPKSTVRVLLDPDNDRALALASGLLGTTKSNLIRLLVDAFLADPVSTKLVLPGLAPDSDELKARLASIPSPKLK
jgi:hypothetical protein